MFFIFSTWEMSLNCSAPSGFLSGWYLRANFLYAFFSSLSVAFGVTPEI